jgi:SAM-dependent methyltransferase
MPISQSELRDLLLAYRQENWNGIQTPEWQRRNAEDMSQESVDIPVLRKVSVYREIPIGTRVLDVGSGVGGLVVACRRRGLRAFGVEPDRIGKGSQLTAIQIARKRVDESVFIAAIGEQLPFSDRSFDLVTLDQVLEHVPDPAAVLREALRVLDDDGIIYAAFPNYLRFYEPHYKIFWIPLMPKRLARWYLRLRARNPVLAEQLTYTTNGRVRRLLRSLGEDLVVIDLNREKFVKKSVNGTFVSKRLRFVSAVNHLPLVGKLTLSIALFCVRLREGGSEMLVLRRKPQEKTGTC